jgi:hypothetical protein
MDAKLKLKLNEAVDAAIDQWKNPAPQSPQRVPQGTQRASQDTQTVSQDTQLASPDTVKMARFVRNRLMKAGTWGKVQAALAGDALAQIFARKLKPPALPLEEKQYVFPGFELPEKLRSVKLPEMRMSRFLVFVDRFRVRSQRDVRRAQELQRLAERLRPFFSGDPTVAVAFARANSHPATLTVVPRVG